jgi:S1-C subfamily serine protease
MRLILFFLSLCVGAAISSEPNKKDLFHKSLLPTVQIISKSKEMSGSGVVYKSIKISPNNFINYVISCQHVISPRMVINTFYYKDENYLEKQLSHGCCLVDEDKQNDLSIVAFLSTEKIPEVTLGTAHTLKLFDSVYSVGCGMEEYPRFTEGKINGLPLSQGTLQDIRTNVPIVPGDSGCALFDKQNKMVGIANSIRKLNYKGMSYPIEGISTFKPVDFVFDRFKENTYDLFEENRKQPEIFLDFIWLLDTEYGY